MGLYCILYSNSKMSFYFQKGLEIAASTIFLSNLISLLNPLSANPTKWSNTLKQFVGNSPTNCLSVFDHFVKLALKGQVFICENFNTGLSDRSSLSYPLLVSLEWLLKILMKETFTSFTNWLMEPRLKIKVLGLNVLFIKIFLKWY